MKDYLLNSENPFEAIKLRNILRLLSVVNETRLSAEPLIEKLYSEQATDFKATLSFLIDIGVLVESENEIKIKNINENRLDRLNVKDIVPYLIEKILRKKSVYRTEFFKYFNKFKFVDGQIVYQPDTLQRPRLSGIRNFLMESGVILYDERFTRYFIASQYFNIYAEASEADSVCSTNMLSQRLRLKDKIALAAEEAVIEFEKERVGTELEKYIEHISLKNVSAGYDIKSITKLDHSKFQPRYIEVKAVSHGSYKFYWTSNEIRVAEILGENYFLYLLPVKGNNNFLAPELKIISDPVSVIMHSSNFWDVETDVICCTYLGI